MNHLEQSNTNTIIASQAAMDLGNISAIESRRELNDLAYNQIVFDIMCPPNIFVRLFRKAWSYAKNAFAK